MSVAPSGPPVLLAMLALMLSSPQDSKTTCSSKSATVFTLPAWAETRKSENQNWRTPGPGNEIEVKSLQEWPDRQGD